MASQPRTSTLSSAGHSWGGAGLEEITLWSAAEYKNILCHTLKQLSKDDALMYNMIYFFIGVR